MIEVKAKKKIATAMKYGPIHADMLRPSPPGSAASRSSSPPGT